MCTCTDSNINRRRQEEDLGLRQNEEETQEEEISGLPKISKQRKGLKNPTSSTNVAPKAREISAELDSSNVLPEGSKCQRKQKARLDPHAAMLSVAGQGSTTIQETQTLQRAVRAHNQLSAISRILISPNANATLTWERKVQGHDTRGE